MAAHCHSGLEPESTSPNWIPACAGMTISKPHCSFNRSNINKLTGPRGPFKEKNVLAGDLDGND